MSELEVLVLILPETLAIKISADWLVVAPLPWLICRSRSGRVLDDPPSSCRSGGGGGVWCSPTGVEKG